ncbi:DMSO/selenate family reductase complex B subunit [Slackia heliotrinireducens]|uniref:DMSO/selenate family reductase complex B subunit n=1 Tax=Slackia heliotrinireducens TaxID=84110 RepID=UPI003314BB93
MTQYGFYFNSARCTGCRTCEMACKDNKDLAETVAFRKIFDYEGGDWTDNGDGTFTQTAFAYHVSAACNHCANPACVANCPTGAMQKDPETGIVQSDPEVCIGCGTCANTCPYSVPVIVEQKSRKCDMCRDRVAAGLRPICVDACPLRALDWGDIEELKTKYPDAVDGIAPLADPSQTTPSILIGTCPACKEVGDTTGMVNNQKEIDLEPAREII